MLQGADASRRLTQCQDSYSGGFLFRNKVLISQMWGMLLGDDPQILAYGAHMCDMKVTSSVNDIG